LVEIFAHTVSAFDPESTQFEIILIIPSASQRPKCAPADRVFWKRSSF